MEILASETVLRTVAKVAAGFSGSHKMFTGITFVLGYCQPQVNDRGERQVGSF